MQTAPGLPPDRLYRLEDAGPKLGPVSGGTGLKSVPVFRLPVLVKCAVGDIHFQMPRLIRLDSSRLTQIGRAAGSRIVHRRSAMPDRPECDQ